MCNALLVMVHGTPRPESNADMYAVVEELKARPDAATRFPVIEAGFMECNEPSIPEAISSCVAQGATRIVAVPYFLHTGAHVADDLPTLIEEAQARYPSVTFAMGDYIGLSPCLTDLIADRAAEATRRR